MNSDINKPNTENSAGIKSIKYVDINNVETVENGIITMKTGFTLKKIQNSFDKWYYEGDFTVEANGMFEVKMSGIISGNDKSLFSNLVTLTNTDLILVVQLDNITYIIGTKEEGIHCKIGNFSGTKPGDETGFKLEFFRKLRKSPMVAFN